MAGLTVGVMWCRVMATALRPRRRVWPQSASEQLAAAQSLCCFQSFAELGDYYLMDFNCKQFTVAFENNCPSST